MPYNQLERLLWLPWSLCMQTTQSNARGWIMYYSDHNIAVCYRDDEQIPQKGCTCLLSCIPQQLFLLLDIRKIISSEKSSMATCIAGMSGLLKDKVKRGWNWLDCMREQSWHPSNAGCHQKLFIENFSDETSSRELHLPNCRRHSKVRRACWSTCGQLMRALCQFSLCRTADSRLAVLGLAGFTKKTCLTTHYICSCSIHVHP